MHDLEFLTASEFANKLKVKNDQVYRWIDDGKVRAIRMNDSLRSPWRIPYTELRRMHASAYENEFDREEEEE